MRKCLLQVRPTFLILSQAIIDGLYPTEVTEDDPFGSISRAEGSKIFLNDWRNLCNDTPTNKPVMHTFFHRLSQIEDAVL